METFSCANHLLQQTVLERVVELSWNGLGYKKIIEVIAKEFSIKLSKGTLSYWFNHSVVLYGGKNHFESKPSKELAYILGVMFGDGSLHFDKKKKDYVVVLSAIDKDFVEKFSKCTSKVLGKENKYSVCPMGGRGYSIIYSARARSKKLYYFIKGLKEDFEKVKPFAEAYPKEFIQGLADSEGCPSIGAKNSFKVGVMVACSTNKYLLNYVQSLLDINFGIESNVYLSKKAGMTDSVIGGRPITRTMDLYVLNTIGLKSTVIFSKSVGFSIGRKMDKLEWGVWIMSNCKLSEQIEKWEEKYFKFGRNWIRKSSKKNFDN